MSTVRDMECICPLCQKNFKERVQGSCSIFGLNLDSMPWGAAIVPSPIVRCPACGFTEGNFSKDDKPLLKEYLKNNPVNQEDPHYYSLAKEYEFLKRADTLIAETYIKAFWEYTNHFRTTPRDPDDEIYLQKLAIEKIDRIQPENQQFFKFQLIKLDLIRRLGDFGKGLSLIDDLKRMSSTGNFPHAKELFQLLDLQKELINKKDTDTHRLPKKLEEPLFGKGRVGMFFGG